MNRWGTQRRRLGLAFGDMGAFMLLKALVALVTAALVWRLTCAVARARIVPTIRFAPLSHMLINGFFFSQGFDMSYFLYPPSGDWAHHGRKWFGVSRSG